MRDRRGWLRDRPRVFALGAVGVVVALFDFWTATSSAVPLQFDQNEGDYYNLLTDGFLHGHLSIPTVPPAGLLKLADPYNPLANAGYTATLHDLALYHGHLYLTWGPTPVVTLFMPWRVLHIGDMTQNLSCLLYAVIGLGFCLSLFEFLLRRYFPTTKVWKAVISGLLLGFGSVVPYMLRTPSVYQVSISAAYCFAMIALYFLGTGGLDDGRVHVVRLGLGSLAVGLAAGAHWDLVLLGLLLVALLVHLVRREALGGRSRTTTAVALLGPAALSVIVLLWYNEARFGSVLQFGASYQLAGYDPTKTPFYELGYLWPSLYYYLIAPVRFTLAFPFVALPPPPAYPGSVPATYVPEIIGGVVTTTPLLVLLLAAPFARALPRALGRACAAVVICGLTMLALIAYALPGGTMRYEADFATFLVLPAVLCWSAWRPATRWRRRVLAVGGAVLAGYGTFVGVAISTTGETDQLRLANPATYDALQRITSPLATFVTMLEGHPDIVRVTDPLAGYPVNRGDYGTDDPGKSFTILQAQEPIDVVSPDAASYEMVASYGKATYAPRGRITVCVENGTVTDHFRFHAGEYGLPVTLHRGLNTIDVWVTIGQPQVPGAFPDILTVHDLRFSKPARVLAPGAIRSTTVPTICG